MDDLISRQTAIKIIKNYCENGCDIAEDNWCPSCQREQFIKLLEALPSSQQEIIRCRDCKYAINIGTPDMMCKNTKAWVVATDNNFGCVFAERRTDGN